MKISSYNIQMTGSHERSEEKSVTTTIVSGRLKPDTTQLSALLMDQAEAPQTRFTLSGQARQLQQQHQSRMASLQQTEGKNENRLDPRIQMIKAVLEKLLGYSIKITQFSPTASSSPTNRAAMEATAQEASTITVLTASHYRESESVSFSAGGVVTTQDGREIRFNLGFSMSREFSESYLLSAEVRQQSSSQLSDPLVLDLGANGMKTDMLNGARFEFDLEVGGDNETIPALGHGYGYLIFDRNANGKVDDGSELFGPATGDGFNELAALDEDGNGWIDENDAVFSRLGVWQPDENGEGRYMTLKEAGVGALYLGRTDTQFEFKDSANNTQGMLRSSGIYLREDGTAATMGQIDLAV